MDRAARRTREDGAPPDYWPALNDAAGHGGVARAVAERDRPGPGDVETKHCAAVAARSTVGSPHGNANVPLLHGPRWQGGAIRSIASTMATAWQRFEIPDHVTVAPGRGDLPCITVRTAWSTATIYLHGGHLATFALHDQPPLLFLSERSRFAAGQAIRGGVPVIFPWFGNREDRPAHGFARTAPWTLFSTARLADGRIAVTLELDTAPPAAVWPPFALRYTITIGAHLELALAVENRAPTPTTFEFCLHTYLHVGDVSRATLHGLQDTRYVDKVDRFIPKRDTAPAVRIDQEVDRVYAIAPQSVTIDDPVLRRRIRIAKEHAPSTVVWNPWSEKAGAMPDLAADDWQHFVCVESGAVADAAITLPSQARHETRAAIVVEAL